MGDAIAQFAKVTYLVPIEKCKREQTSGADCFYQFSTRGRMIFPLTDLNLSFIWRLISIVRQKKPDVIWVSNQFGILALKTLFPKKNCVFISHDVLPDAVDSILNGNRPTANKKKSAKLTGLVCAIASCYERTICKTVDKVFAVSESDRDRYLRLYGLSKEKFVTVAPTFNAEIETSLSRDEQKSVTVVFHGSSSYLPNKEAIDLLLNEITEKALQRDSTIKFLIAGLGTKPQKGASYEVLGFVKDINDFFRYASIAVIPILKGTGLRMKALDYMKAGIPIVSTKEGLGGLQLRNGVEAIICDKSSSCIASAVVTLAHDAPLRKKMAKNALDYIYRYYSKEALARKLKPLYYRFLVNE